MFLYVFSHSLQVDWDCPMLDTRIIFSSRSSRMVTIFGCKPGLGNFGRQHLQICTGTSTGRQIVPKKPPAFPPNAPNWSTLIRWYRPPWWLLLAPLPCLCWRWHSSHRCLGLAKWVVHWERHRHIFRRTGWWTVEIDLREKLDLRMLNEYNVIGNVSCIKKET